MGILRSVGGRGEVDLDQRAITTEDDIVDLNDLDRSDEQANQPAPATQNGAAGDDEPGDGQPRTTASSPNRTRREGPPARDALGHESDEEFDHWVAHRAPRLTCDRPAPPVATPSPAHSQAAGALNWRHPGTRPASTLRERLRLRLASRRFSPQRRKLAAEIREHDGLQGPALEISETAPLAASSQAPEDRNRRPARRHKRGHRPQLLSTRAGRAAVLSVGALMVVAAVALAWIGIGASHRPRASRQVAQIDAIAKWRPLPRDPIRTAATLPEHSNKPHRHLSRRHSGSTDHPRASASSVAHHVDVSTAQGSASSTFADNSAAQTASSSTSTPVTSTPTSSPAGTPVNSTAASAGSSSSSNQPAFGMNGALGPGHGDGTG